MTIERSNYSGQTIAFLTQHQKELLVAPVFEASLGCALRRVSGFDTDRLGTFTREIPRDGTQVEASRKKAHLAVQLSGMRLGLGSEGAFGPDPMIGMIPWNLEVLTLFDAENQLEVTALAQGPAKQFAAQVATWEELLAFAERAEFPSHHLVLRPVEGSRMNIIKGVSAQNDLAQAFSTCRRQSPDGSIFVESDLRAHANPTRQSRIREAAVQLCERLCSRCPTCGSPGFWIAEQLSGLPCEGCGAPTEMTRGEVWTCLRCPERVEKLSSSRAFASPSVCGFCNP